MSQRKIKRPPKYLPDILALFESRSILQTPGVHHVMVRHDDWCDLLNSRGECNCNPDVGYVATEGRN